MTILLLLIPISLALLGVAVWAFVWAVRRGQFDDLDSAALDILADDRAPTPVETPRATATSASAPPPAVSTAGPSAMPGSAAPVASAPPQAEAASPPAHPLRSDDHAD